MAKKAKKRGKKPPAWKCKETSRTVTETREKGKRVVYVVVRGRCVKQ